MSLVAALRQAAKAAERTGGLPMIAQRASLQPGEIDRLAYGVGGIAGLGGLAIPATAYAMNTDAERLRQEARHRWLMDQIENGTPELRDRLDMLSLRDEALRMDIAALRNPPPGMTQSMRPRVFYPRPNERRQDAQGYMGGGE